MFKYIILFLALVSPVFAIVEHPAVTSSNISNALPSQVLTQEYTSYTSFTPSDVMNVAAGSGVATINARILRIQGSGGAVDVTANPQIVDGVAGQEIVLVGEHDTNTVTLDDGTGLQLAGAVSFVMGDGDIIFLYYDADADIWREVSRSDN